jgi:hypothetical protein
MRFDLVIDPGDFGLVIDAFVLQIDYRAFALIQTHWQSGNVGIKIDRFISLLSPPQ